MFNIKALTIILMAGLAFIAFTGCDKKQDTSNASTSAADKKPEQGNAAQQAPDNLVIAVVNGREISQYELVMSLGRRHAGDISREQMQEALDRLIGEELIYQDGISKGLDNNAYFRRIVDQMEFRLNATKRRQMEQLVYKKEIAASVNVSDQEVRDYFEKNKELLQVEYHLYGLSYVDIEKAKEAEKKIQAGAKFEDLAKDIYGNREFPKGKMPWDMGYLSILRVPETWKNDIHRLKTGETSKLLHDEKSGFRIIKLLDKRVNEKIGYDQARPQITNVLRKEKIDEAFKKYREELKSKASITINDIPEVVQPNRQPPRQNVRQMSPQGQKVPRIRPGTKPPADHTAPATPAQ
ncbi:MAG: peptidyl-prolyl cis-trans isomerase [Deltaproteobacteria bacterium]|nr:peptidyl-prolyl cis-trans isomerase [Deltaproteobacteria bacterium]